MTRAEAFKEINDTQEYYINELIKLINDKSNNCFKALNFTSPTGTGKTNMMALLCNKLSNFYFVITTLSKGQLNHQIESNMKKLVNQDNFMIYGLCDYKSNSRLTATEIINRLPKDKQIIWLRDEGHINTNKWQEVLSDICFKVINFSATNKESTGIVCNFTNTMMLRTVNQAIGTPEDALDKLLEVKKHHLKVKNYNPCAIMRCLDESITNQIISACNDRQLKYINITEDDFDVSELCKDDNDYDVIINKFKIVEGIDIRRAHVLYMTNEPNNIDTTIQAIGRCRRNALLYRNDIDIFSSSNETLLKDTRQCFVYYNVKNMKVSTDIDGELCKAFCARISCQQLKPNSTIKVTNGQLDNGLNILELDEETGTYTVEIDSTTGFNIIKPEGNFYNTEIIQSIDEQYIYMKPRQSKWTNDNVFTYRWKVSDIINNLTLAEQTKTKRFFDFATGCSKETLIESIFGYDLLERTPDIKINLTPGMVNSFLNSIKKASKDNALIKKNKRGTFTVSYIESKEAATQFSLNTLSMSDIPNIASLDLNQQLFNLFFGKALNKSYKHFNNQRKAKKYLIEHSKDLLYIAPNDMEYNKPYTINIKGKYKIDPEEVTLSAKNAQILINSTNTIDNDIGVSPIVSRQAIIQLQQKAYEKYTKINNDRESAIIGVDNMKCFTNIDDKDKITIWVEDKAVTSKVSKYSKFNTFIKNKYKTIIEEISKELFNGKNTFEFSTRCNSVLGYCVEYYSKYLVYGIDYLYNFIKLAQHESRVDYINDYIIIRACMLKYKDMIGRAFGKKAEKLVLTISVEQLIKDDYKKFVETVIKLGTKTAKFVKVNLVNDGKIYDPNLSIKHITGLADYINHDTIIDIKTTNNITEQYVKQVLGYYYLSTKRSDLDIKHLIVYDAVSGKSVKIDL